MIPTLAALVALELGWGAWRHSSSELGPASWIWSAERVTAPKAIDLARDFELHEVPERALLRVAVDESFLLYVNGRWVGAGQFGREGSIAEFEIADLLHLGANRLVLEARSRTGSGGAAAALFLDGAERPFLVTDRDWVVIEQHAAGLLEGTAPLGGAPPHSWGRHPTGRWGGARELTVGRRIDRLEKQRPALEQHRVPGKPPRLVVDFGAVVEGYLEIWSDLGASGAKLTFAASREEAERSARRRPRQRRQAVRLLTVPGLRVWRDHAPRRYRWVVIDSPHPIDGARVWLAPATAAEPRSRGLWGLEPRRR